MSAGILLFLTSYLSHPASIAFSKTPAASISHKSLSVRSLSVPSPARPVREGARNSFNEVISRTSKIRQRDDTLTICITGDVPCRRLHVLNNLFAANVRKHQIKRKPHQGFFLRSGLDGLFRGRMHNSIVRFFEIILLLGRSFYHPRRAEHGTGSELWHLSLVSCFLPHKC